MAVEPAPLPERAKSALERLRIAIVEISYASERLVVRSDDNRRGAQRQDPEYYELNKLWHQAQVIARRLEAMAGK